jgi:DNA-binding transcriptional LysR family regulator
MRVRSRQTLAEVAQNARHGALCADEGFTPRIGYTSDDLVVMQALVVAGLGVTTIPGLALRAHRAKGIVATKLPESRRHVYAATYGANSGDHARFRSRSRRRRDLTSGRPGM